MACALRCVACSAPSAMVSSHFRGCLPGQGPGLYLCLPASWLVSCCTLCVAGTEKGIWLLSFAAGSFQVCQTKHVKPYNDAGGVPVLRF
jgi:hypothetical protein